MNRLLMLGGDSFVGRSFVSMQSTFADCKIVSRKASLIGTDESIVEDPFTINESLFREEDIVFNCFGIAHQKERDDPQHFYRVNRDLVFHLASRAKRAGVKMFIQMSTTSVYGNIEWIDSSVQPHPSSHYGRSKAQADELLESLASAEFSVLLIRPPMLYGPHAPGNMAKLLGMVKRLPILPFLRATEPRDFLYIGNFVKYVEAAIRNELKGILLLRDSEALSTRWLVEAMAQELGLRRLLVPLPFGSVFRKLFPEYYRKLYGPLRIVSNIGLDTSKIAGIVDNRIALKATIKGFD